MFGALHFKAKLDFIASFNMRVINDLVCVWNQELEIVREHSLYDYADLLLPCLIGFDKGVWMNESNYTGVFLNDSVFPKQFHLHPIQNTDKREHTERISRSCMFLLYIIWKELIEKNNNIQQIFNKVKKVK